MTDIVDKIRKHENNNTVEIIDLIISENFNVQRGLVYSYDQDTVVKRIYTTQNAETYDSFLGLQNGINMNVKERTIIEESMTNSYDDERKSVMEMRN